MPLRDHFRPPVWRKASWEGFHGMWPAVIVQRLVQLLPAEYSAEPRARLGSYYEIDVGSFEEDEPEEFGPTVGGDSGGVATATRTAPEPTLTLEADLADQAEYEVLVYDQERRRELVAAVEIVSPANKASRANRRAFVAKCAALLQKGVCVSIVDLVTVRRFNLYTELLALIERSDPAFATKTPVYAVTSRGRKVGHRPLLENWAYPLAVGQPLPTLPLWLTEELWVPLDLEASYEETCRVLRLP